MKTLQCCVCGIEFCLTEGLYKQRLKDGQAFSCPNGHKQSFIESYQDRIDKLEVEIKELEKTIHWYKDVLVPNLTKEISHLKRQRKSARLSAANYRARYQRLVG